MADTVLFVDDEVFILDCVAKIFEDKEFRVLTASNPFEALDIIKNEEVAVLVSDHRMPGMNGIDLLSKVKEISPDTKKILMTGYADLTIAVEAINKGEVFRFIAKPWENTVLIKTIEDALNNYRIIHSLKKGDEATMLSLAQTIELKDPYTRGHCTGVAKYALMIADALEMPEHIKRDIQYGCWLHDCGKIGVPESILNYPGKLSEKDFEVVKKHPCWGADVARQAHLTDVIVNIILYHHEKYDGTGYPNGLKGKNIPLEARIVSIADVFDALTTDRPYRKGYGKDEALDIMAPMKEKSFDPELLDSFFTLIKNEAPRKNSESCQV